MTRKEKLAKRKSLVSLARYLVSKSKKKIELQESREHDRQEAKARAENPPKKSKKKPWTEAKEQHTHTEECAHEE